MKLFHGSNLDINEIDLSKCRPYKDFGKGFYLTELEDQAVKMAKRVARLYGGDPIVNVHSFDEKTLKVLLLMLEILAEQRVKNGRGL